MKYIVGRLFVINESKMVEVYNVFYIMNVWRKGRDRKLRDRVLGLCLILEIWDFMLVFIMWNMIRIFFLIYCYFIFYF